MKLKKTVIVVKNTKRRKKEKVAIGAAMAAANRADHAAAVRYFGCVRNRAKVRRALKAMKREGLDIPAIRRYANGKWESERAYTKRMAVEMPVVMKEKFNCRFIRMS